MLKKEQQQYHLKQQNEQLIAGFRQHDRRVIANCYEEAWPVAEKLVLNNSGDLEDAKDLMGEGFEVFYNACLRPDFALNCRFSTFMYAVFYKLWMKKLRERKRELKNNEKLINGFGYDIRESETLIALSEVNMDTLIYGKSLNDVVLNLLNDIPEDCRKMFLLKHEEAKTHEEIADLLNISVTNSRSRLHRCSIFLAQTIKESPDFQYLMENYPFLNKYIDKTRKK